jgi:hypothetical protein
MSKFGASLQFIWLKLPRHHRAARDETAHEKARMSRSACGLKNQRRLSIAE